MISLVGTKSSFTIPTAVLAFKREGYNLIDFNVKDTVDALKFRYYNHTDKIVSAYGNLIIQSHNTGYFVWKLHYGPLISASWKLNICIFCNKCAHFHLKYCSTNLYLHKIKRSRAYFLFFNFSSWHCHLFVSHHC